MKLKEVGLDVGECRVGRLMRINAIRPVRTRKHKVTTDSHHRLGVAAVRLRQPPENSLFHSDRGSQCRPYD